MVDAQKLSVFMYMPDDWRLWQQLDVFSAPEHYTQDDVTVTLDVAARIEWIMRDSTASQEAYMGELFAARTGPESPVEDGCSSGSEGS